MGSKNREKKSSNLPSVLNLFRSNKSRGGHQNHLRNEEGKMSGEKVWPSDEDNGRWGVADPRINKRADDYIRDRKKRLFESEN